MLDVANKYEKELQQLFMDTWYDDKYKFFHNSCYSDMFQSSNSNWDNHQFISKDNEGNIIGYIAYEISRGNDYVDGLAAINFSDDKLTFGKDLMTAVTSIFDRFRFRKLIFSVVVGNPIERSYDRLILKYGGRTVGVHKQHCRLIDNQFYDSKIYEITREDYLQSVSKR